MPALLTVDQMCQELQCSKVYLYRRIKDGLPVFTHVGKQHRFNLADVMAWLKTQKTGKKPRAKKDTPAPLPVESTESVSISEKAIMPIDTAPVDTELVKPIVTRPELFTPPVESLHAPVKAKDKPKIRKMSMIEKAANMHKNSLHTLAVQTKNNAESIAHTKQGLTKACPVYIDNGQCCEERPAICPLTAYEKCIAELTARNDTPNQ